MTTTTGTWLVRREGSTSGGIPMEFRRLAQRIADGTWTEDDEVRAPGEAAWRLIGDTPQLEEFLPARNIFASRPIEEAEMDMTPMIDVTFQLIIFFMITAAFVIQKTLDMPKASPNTPGRQYTMQELQKDNIIVTVRTGGAVTVDGSPAEMDGVEKALREAVRGRDNVEMVLDVDDEVEHATVVKVIDGAAGAEIERIHFVRHAPPGGTG